MIANNVMGANEITSCHKVSCTLRALNVYNVAPRQQAGCESINHDFHCLALLVGPETCMKTFSLKQNDCHGNILPYRTPNTRQLTEPTYLP